MFWDDSVHDVEITVESLEEVRGAVVQVLRNFKPLLGLSKRWAGFARGGVSAPTGTPPVRG